MSRQYPQISLTPLEIDRLLSYLRPLDDGSHLKKKLIAARDRYDSRKRQPGGASFEYDPTPWCHQCGAMRERNCHCGPIAENH